MNLILSLIQKELKLEWRYKYSLGGLVLYLVSTVFITQLCLKGIINPSVWTTLFWIIILFASINTVAKSFIADRMGRVLYYYSFVSPTALIISKMIYFSALLLVMALLNHLLLSFFLGNFIQNQGLFLITLLIGSIGIASVLTLISGVVSRTNGNMTLLAILSFPLLLPLLLVLIKLTGFAMNPTEFIDYYKYLLVLLALDITVIILSVILFRFIWLE